MAARPSAPATRNPKYETQYLALVQNGRASCDVQRETNDKTRFGIMTQFGLCACASANECGHTCHLVPSPEGTKRRGGVKDHLRAQANTNAQRPGTRRWERGSSWSESAAV
eukprot:2813449-Pleurochrysis_carterae.AAC.2